MDDSSAIVVKVESLLSNGCGGEDKRSEWRVEEFTNTRGSLLSLAGIYFLATKLNCIMSSHLLARTITHKGVEAINIDCGCIEVHGGEQLFYHVVDVDVLPFEQMEIFVQN